MALKDDVEKFSHDVEQCAAQAELQSARLAEAAKALEERIKHESGGHELTAMLEAAKKKVAAMPKAPAAAAHK